MPAQAAVPCIVINLDLLEQDYTVDDEYDADDSRSYIASREGMYLLDSSGCA